MERSTLRSFPVASRRVPTILALVALLAALPAVALAQANGKLQIHHIKVGQGDGILLISPLGQTALFDDGVYTDCTEIKNYLQTRGITTVNYHFASHYHADHIGCIDDLAAIGITIGTAGYDRGYSYSSATYTNYVNTLGAKRQTIVKDQIITLDAGAANPVHLKCVNVNGAGVYSPTGSDENAKSLVMKVSYGAFDEVIGGDLTGDAAGGKDVESTIGPQCGDVEVYKVHHHGSRYSTNDNWLAATTPEVAIIQVGSGNSYGHPTADALGRMHARGVKTYWTESGAGASPNPTYDTVANGAVVVQADPGAGAAYTVSGPSFTHTYYNGGGAPPPPINTTEVAEAITLLKGSISTGDVTRLAANDASRVSISAGVESGSYVTDWYGSVILDHPPLNLAITYDGNYTVTRTQYLYLWNWTTAQWVQIDNTSVGTTDKTRTWSTTTPASYVSASREVRLRVRGSLRSSGSYTCRGDYMAFNYDYTQGTAPAFIATRPAEEAGIVAAAEADRFALSPVTRGEFAGESPVHAGAEVADARGEERPLESLVRADATSRDGASWLLWAIRTGDHVDGFNVYREDGGRRMFVGNEAGLDTRGEETWFRFVDAHAPAGAVYWLGVRGCSGPEALIGPLRAAPVGPATLALGLVAAPNPARGVARFRLTVPAGGDAALDVFDAQGRRVATPWRGALETGEHALDWDLRDAAGAPVAPGLYFARLEAAGRTVLRRLTVLGN